MSTEEEQVHERVQEFAQTIGRLAGQLGLRSLIVTIEHEVGVSMLRWPHCTEDCRTPNVCSADAYELAARTLKEGARELRDGDVVGTSYRVNGGDA
jgi:hypothetical protein